MGQIKDTSRPKECEGFMGNLVSVHVYRNNKDEIICIPHVLDEDGILRNVNMPQITSVIMGESDIGNKVLTSIKDCIGKRFNKEELQIPVYEKASGKKWGAFFKDSICVIIEMSSSGYMIYSTTKNNKYKSFEDFQIVRQLPLDSSSKVIGIEVLNAFNHCL